MDNTIIKIGKLKITDEMAVIGLVVSLYLPYIISYLALATLFLAVIINPRSRKAVFSPRSMWLLYGFAISSMLGSVMFGNLLGVVCTIGIFAVITVGLYCMSVMTKELFLNSVKWIFKIMPVVALATIIEFAYRFYCVELCDQKIRFMLRCKGFFFNPNYFGAMMAMTALICIYHFVAFKKDRLKSVFVGVCALVCLLLTQSMFGYIELLVGAIVLLIVAHKWRYLAVLITILFLCATVVIVVPDILPRLGEMGESFDLRVRIWRVAAKGFWQSPIFGQGPLTYFHIYKDYEGAIPGVKVWPTQHAHNLFIDGLLNFGFVGATLLWSWYVALTVDVLRSLKRLGSKTVASLVIAMAVGLLVHGMVDVTVLWSQTGIMLLFIVSFAKQKTIEY